jgi:amino acid adenylation domain-containing protein
LNASSPLESVPVRFRRIASQFADRIAISAPGAEWTFAELDHRSNVIAREILNRLGEAPAPVALLLDHGAPLVAAILGALKAGKMYFVLDAAHPKERLTAALANSETRLLLTDTINLPLADSLASGSLKVLEIAQNVPENFSRIELPDVPPTAGAWLMYTSGSTGEPKGIWENHAGIVRHSDVYRDLVQLTPADRLTLLTSCGLSASGTPLFSALLHGATLCPFAIRSHGVERLAAWLRERRVTIYHSVPTIFRHLATVPSAKAAFETVRLIRLGGEPLMRNDVELFRQLASDNCRLMNSFSSTETGLVTAMTMDKNSPPPDGRVPVGHPVRGVEVLLLDEHNQSVATGAEGRIAVRSAHLRQGYWRQPADSGTGVPPVRFDSHGRDARATKEPRLFITADLGKFLSDGSLEHLGRADDVVKIQGQRVDLRAVEIALLATRLVKESAATAPEDSTGERRLAAYFVPHDGADVSPQNLRAQLRAHLPEHFIPSRFVPLEKLPQTPGGKIDRHALPPLPKIETTLDAASLPQNSIEKKLAFIWESTLGVSPIGRRDDFFDLGGTSLKMVEVGVAIEDYFNIALPSSTLVAHSTIEKLAPLLSPSIAVTSPRPLVSLRNAAHGRPLFLVHSGLGEVVTYGLLARKLSERPIYGLQASGLQGESWPLMSIPKIADRYLPEILACDPTGPYLLAGTCMGGMVAFELAQRLVRLGRRVSLLALIDSPTAPYTGRRAIWHEVFLDPLRDALRIVRWSILRQRGLKVRQLHAYRRFVAAMTERANRRYHPSIYPGVVTLLLTADTKYRVADRRKLISGYARETRVCMIPGTRTGLFMRPQVDELARQLQICLEAADREIANPVPGALAGASA